MIYRLSTFADICPKEVKRDTILRALETRSSHLIDERNTVCVVKTWGNFTPTHILQYIDGEFIGERTFEELSIALENLADIKQLIKLEWDYRTVNIEYNSTILLTIVNQSVSTEQALFLDLNEWCRQLHLATRPSKWSTPPVHFSAGFLAGIVGCATLLFLQSRIKY